MKWNISRKTKWNQINMKFGYNIYIIIALLNYILLLLSFPFFFFFGNFLFIYLCSLFAFIRTNFLFCLLVSFELLSFQCVFCLCRSHHMKQKTKGILYITYKGETNFVIKSKMVICPTSFILIRTFMFKILF